MKYKIVRVHRMEKAVEAHDELEAYSIGKALFDEDYKLVWDDLEIHEVDDELNVAHATPGDLSAQPVDALAVMDRYANSILPGKLWDGSNPYCVRPGFTGSDYSKDVADLIEARAAVAELVEADKEYDAARLSGNAYRMADAANRRRAALARVGGAK